MKEGATWLPPFLGCALVAAVFWPGLMSPDSVYQLEMARQGLYTDWHPPLFLILWRRADKLLPGPGGMLLLQGAVLWTALALFTRAALGPGLLAGLVALLLGALPPLWSELAVIWKDVLFSGSLLLASALLLTAQRRSSRAAAICALPPLGLALALRYNALFAALPLCLWAGALLAGPPRRRAMALGLALLAGLFSGAWLVTRRIPVHRMYPVQQILLHDLAAISLSSGENFYPEYLRDKGVDLEKLRALYRPDLADRITFAPGMATIDPNQVRALWGQWGDGVAHHPLAYLSHRMSMARSLLAIGGNPVLPYWDRVTENKLGVSLAPSRPREAALALLARLGNTWLFRPWVYLALLVLAMVHARRDRAAIAIGTSGLLHELAAVFLVPVADFRYSFWMGLAALAVTLVAVSGGVQRPFRKIQMS